MQPEFLARLPDDLSQLVLDTEEAIGFPVEVVLSPEPARGPPGQRDPMACVVEKDYAQMLVASADQFRPSSVFHELLHIRRFLVEGVPKLVDAADYDPWTPAIRDACVLHDNAFEHLVIVAQELQAFPASRAHWEDVMARVWAGVAAGRGTDIERRQLGLACWAFIRHVLPDSQVIHAATAALEASNRLEEANEFCEALLPTLGDKKAAMRVWLDRQKVPLEMVSLQYLFPRELRAREVSFAD